MTRRVVVTETEMDTMELGASLVDSLAPGTVVLLEGELGAGKTAFVRGLAIGLGAPEEDVSSPTFTLVQEYRGRMPFLHADLYRISGAEADELGLDELGRDGVVAIEWAAKLLHRPVGAVEVLLEDLGGDRRRNTIVRPDLRATSPGPAVTTAGSP
jgi:tRNA threonylcarbamoyladenosine biosynthesis protein TsaE